MTHSTHSASARRGRPRTSRPVQSTGTAVDTAAPSRATTNHPPRVERGAPAPRVEPGPAGTFADLALPRDVVAALAQRNLTTMFPIQESSIPDALAGRDVLGRGRTGSGKTLAFGLPLLVRVADLEPAESRRPRGLVLVPTRELAQQIADALEPYAALMELDVATVVGGLSIERQIATLRVGVDILIATPGRLEDLIRRKACHLGDVMVAVLDEADQMADMGFLPVVTRLMDQVARDGQRLLFSATLDGDVDKLVRRFMTDPVTHSVDPMGATVEEMTHHVLHLSAEDKPMVTAEIAAGDGKVIMFVRTKHAADRLSKHLARVGVRAAALHGGKSQNARTRALARLRDGELDALVATNVAARGIHIDGIDYVVNVDPPTEPKDYLHRGGRTARAGNSGSVVTLVLPEQRREVSRMMATVGISPESISVRPGASELTRVTGARRPSGIPIEAAPPAARTAAGEGRPARRRRPGRAPEHQGRSTKPRQSNSR